MWRRVRSIILPALAITLIVGGVFASLSLAAREYYRQTSSSELARLIGVVAERYPDLDPAELIRALRSDNPDIAATGSEILRAYGYTAADFTTASAATYSAALILLGLAAIICIGGALAGYLYYRDCRYRRQIWNLVEYVQKLNDHVYDLRIESNTEEELSLLSNELYKITVTLKESAEFDRRARRQLETALADISHQLKTPLTSLQIALDNLSSDPDMPLAVRQDFLRSSSRQVVAMSGLVTTLLNLAKFDNGTIRMQRRVMPISDILTQVQEKLEILADLQNVRVEITGDVSAQVKLDPRWQAEALANIVKNCIEHSPAHSVITINVDDAALYTRVTIRDQGEGIAPQDLHHIFERFYKSGQSTPSQAGSTHPDISSINPTSVGIGLSFAKSVIEADHGQIRVKSTQKAEPHTSHASSSGTTFTITYFH